MSNIPTVRSALTDALRADGEYRQLLDAIRAQRKSRPKPIMASGLCDGATDMLCAALVEDVVGALPVLMLCAEEKECISLRNTLSAFGIRALFYPARDLNFHNITASREFEQSRLAVLLALVRGEADVILTTPDASLGYTVPPASLKESVITLSDKLEGGPALLAERLAAAGYSRTSLAEGAGQFALRGGILDVCMPSAESDGNVRAVRIEFFGDEVDRIGFYDVTTQRVTESLGQSEVVLPPAREILPSPADLASVGKAISALRKKSTDARVQAELDAELGAIDAAIASGAEVRFIDKYISLVYPEKVCLLDYFSSLSLCIFRSNAAVSERLKAWAWRSNQEVSAIVESGLIAGKYAEFSAPVEKIEAFKSARTTILLDSLMQGVSGLSLGGLFGFRTKHSVSFGENDELLREELTSFSGGGYRVILMTSGETQGKNYAGLLSEWGFDAKYYDTLSALTLDSIARGGIAVIPSCPVRPLELPSPRIAVISLLAEGARSTTRKKREGKSQRRDSSSKRILSYAELSEGDYVVHENHGIGMYMGITTMEVGGVTHDYITIQYAGADKLFMPVEKLDKVSKLRLLMNKKSMRLGIVVS